MISSHCFPETQFIAVTAYQNEEVRQPGRERRREGTLLALAFFFGNSGDGELWVAAA
jgi:hypothetical protein